MDKICLVLLVALLGGSVTAHPTSQDALQVLDSSPARDPKLFFQFVTISPDKCTTDSTNYPDGRCYKSDDCKNLGGTASGSCANGLGVCCYFTVTCDDTIKVNETRFINPGSPTDVTTALTCTVSVDLIGTNICQLRLDFNDFELAQPNAESLCQTDFMRVTGTTNDDLIPQLCGSNDGQHIYVGVDPKGSNPKITIDTGMSTTTARSWDITVSQIECTSLYKAPDNCLQYYQAASGVVESFNYRQPTTTDPGNIHLGDLNYQACIKAPDDYCTIQWFPNPSTNTYAFIISGDADVSSNFIGEEAGQVEDPLDTTNPCTDYVTIQGSTFTRASTDLQADRFCGIAFPSMVTSTTLPFTLGVVTDSIEASALDVNNAGYSLGFRTLAC